MNHRLNKIAAQIRTLARQLDEGFAINPDDLAMIARRIDAQAEMMVEDAKPDRNEK